MYYGPTERGGRRRKRRGEERRTGRSRVRYKKQNLT
jgi:hypothetical protein